MKTKSIKKTARERATSPNPPTGTLSGKFRDCIRKFLPRDLVASISIFRNRTYIEDGLITTHVADFCNDVRFMRAYQIARETGSWNGSDLRWRVYTACWAAKHASILPGDFVECGVNRGGMSLAVMEYIDFNALNKRFFLLDTYCGFPESMVASASAANLHSYRECYDHVVRTFKPFSGARVIAGSVPDTLPQVDTDKLCYLSIDMNCAEPEIEAMKFFWRKLVPGAVVLLDDYAFSNSYRPQKQAFDALAKELNFNILSLPTGQGLIVKT
ncbi:MAG: TylF/MycF/NovP-related O-methyltransferase [Candidatus Acidiferrales bacterium]